MPRVRLLNTEFDRLTLAQTVDAVFNRLASGQRGWLCTVNVAILMMMRNSRLLQGFVERAAVVVADGQPLVWCSRFAGQAMPERVTGVDLLELLCERASRDGKRVYLLGAATAVVTAAAAELRARHPRLLIDYADGYFPDEEAAARADRIARSGADILFVAMGVPRQERFILEQWDRLGVGMAIGIGGSLDVIAGQRLRAPALLQQAGCEWLFRLAQEPRRLFRRYLVTNVQFLWVLSIALLRGALTAPGSPQQETEMVGAPAGGPDVELDVDEDPSDAVR